MVGDGTARWTLLALGVAALPACPSFFDGDIPWEPRPDAARPPPDAAVRDAPPADATPPADVAWLDGAAGVVAAYDTRAELLALPWTTSTSIDFEGIVAPGEARAYNTAAGFTTAGVNFVCPSSCDPSGLYWELYVVSATYGLGDRNWGTGDTICGDASHGCHVEPGGHVLVTFPAGVRRVGMDFMTADPGGAHTPRLCSFLVTVASGRSYSYTKVTNGSLLAFIGFDAVEDILTVSYASVDLVNTSYAHLDNLVFGY